MMRIRRQQRLAGMYVVVLMTAMIVTVIGLSGLAATRVRLRSAEATGDVISARFYARSAMEVALLLLQADSGWRTTYSHDTWTADQAIGEGIFSWKLVDELNGDLAADPSAPVRLYGKGSLGETVRICSVLLQPDDAPPNLLSNPGMENGASDWPGYDCTVSSYTADWHNGAKSLAVTNRLDYWAGPYQDITGTIEIDTTYDIAVWVKMRIGSSPVRIVMWVGSEWPWEGFDGQWRVGGDTWVGDGEWTRVTATLTPTWSGDLNAAFVKVGTSSGSSDFYMDDIAMHVAVTGVDIEPVAGTWRREVDP